MKGSTSRSTGQSRGYQYAICLKEDDIPIGYVKVDLDESHDLGYGLRHEFWHRGIAAEAARALVEQVRRTGCLISQPLTM